MLKNTTQIYITDKNGGKHFNTLCSTDYYMSEKRNLDRHLMQASLHPEHYSFIDVESAKVVVEHSEPQITDEELLKQLGV